MRSDKSEQAVVVEPNDPDPELPDARRRELRRSHEAVLAVIAVGGALGALARFGAGRLWPTARGSFPWTKLGVNAVGCLVIGVFLVAVTELWSAHRLLRPFFATGVLGGFTTFSTYCVDIQRLADGRHAGTALVYLVATVAAALVAVSAGAWSARRIWAKWSM